MIGKTATASGPRKSKRDFLFIDESGSTGPATTDYYIVGILHVTDQSLKEISIHLGALRYFGDISKELKSGQMKPETKNQLVSILRHAGGQKCFIRASATYIRKSTYEGAHKENATSLQHYILRRALRHHFETFPPASFTGGGPGEIELVIDRFHPGALLQARLAKYLRTNVFSPLPPLMHITHADSRYVELLQAADWIAGCIKDSIFTEKKCDADILNLINTLEIK